MAFTWLEKASRERDVRLSLLNADPKWEIVRGETRLAELVRRMGLKSQA